MSQGSGVAFLFALALLALWHGSAPAAPASRAPADLIVYGDYVVPMEDGAAVIEKGAVAIRGDTILAVDGAAAIDAAYEAPASLPGEGRVVLPGLINGHTHAAMVLFRGIADDLELMTWLEDYIFPMEGRFVDEDFIETGMRLACWEMIRGGTTTFVDMYFFPGTAARVVGECGLRAVIAAPMIDHPSPGFEGWEDSFAAGVDFAKAWKDRHSRITPALGPHAAYSVAPGHLRAALKAAKDIGVPISIHVAEAPSEMKQIEERYGTTPVTHLEAAGYLDHAVIAAHMVYPLPGEIERLAGGRMYPVHNPTSNMKTAAGLSPVVPMRKAGIPVGLGTDGAASNNDLDLWEEMRLAALMHKGATGDPTAIPAAAALAMATREGARAIHMEERIGTLAPGRQADLIQVSLQSPRLAPVYDVVSHLVYAVDSADVVTTIVAGEILMREGAVLTVNGRAAAAAAQAKADAIRAVLNDRETENK